MSSDANDQFPEELQKALNQGLLKRLPRTFLPFTRQQLRDWTYLFPHERQSVSNLLVFLANLSQEESTALFQEILRLEEKMGVRSWRFSTEEQTILNASLLARSPYYQEWRAQVQKVFDAAEKHAAKTKIPKGTRHRLILSIIPKELAPDRAAIWRRWQSAGRIIRVDTGSLSAGQSLVQRLLTTPEETTRTGLLDVLMRCPKRASTDTWVLDAGRELIDFLAQKDSWGGHLPVLLSYERLASFRQEFSREINTMQKDLTDADSVFDHLRKYNVTPLCPPEIAGVPLIREYVRSLYLSGNGALIFGNSFVQWGASEALRRARPDFLVARFGVRSKPKPFTSVAVFENPDQVNPLPAVDDLPGSALDAQVLSHYVWLAANRYEEYRTNTAFVCLAEALAEAYVIAPPEFMLSRETQPVPLERLDSALTEWMS